MKTYLKDIGSVSLLTGEQEVELAMRIQDLVYLEGVREQLEEEAKRRKQTSEVSNFDWAIAANVTERELKERLDAGKRAKNQMIQANLRLVVSIAKRYANKSMSFQDLIQEGCVGLIRGAEKFDFKRGYKFSTYAHWWIRQAVTRSISDQSRTIRLPVHLFEIISRMSKVERQLVMKYGRDPTTEEIAEVMDMTVEKINQIQKASLVPISLSQSVNDDDSRTVEETLVDDHAEHPDDATGKVLLKEDLENVLNTLSPRERDVLRLRYGMDDGRVKTLEEIGNVFSVTRERIRQIEAKALRKLRQPSRNGILREYLPNDHDAVKGDVGDIRGRRVSERVCPVGPPRVDDDDGEEEGGRTAIRLVACCSRRRRNRRRRAVSPTTILCLVLETNQTKTKPNQTNDATSPRRSPQER